MKTFDVTLEYVKATSRENGLDAALGLSTELHPECLCVSCTFLDPPQECWCNYINEECNGCHTGEDEVQVIKTCTAHEKIKT